MSFIVALMGKSGCGKDFARDYLAHKYKLNKLISHTSRPPRTNEVQGVDYYFVDKFSFINLYQEGTFVQTRSYDVEYQGNYDIWHYGLCFNELKKDKGITIHDLDGTILLKNILENCKVIYIHSDNDVREVRAKARDKNFCSIEWSRRLNKDSFDFPENKVIKCADYFINNNGDLDEFKQDLDNVMEQILVEN